MNGLVLIKVDNHHYAEDFPEYICKVLRSEVRELSTFNANSQEES